MFNIELSAIMELLSPVDSHWSWSSRNACKLGSGSSRNPCIPLFHIASVGKMTFPSHALTGWNHEQQVLTRRITVLGHAAVFFWAILLDIIKKLLQGWFPASYKSQELPACCIMSGVIQSKTAFVMVMLPETLTP